MSTLLMYDGTNNSDSARTLDDIIKHSAAVDRDCQFLFQSHESQSIRDHARRCPIDGSCRCGVFSFPDVRSLQTSLFADSGDKVPERTTVEITDHNITVGLKNFANAFHTQTTTNSKILASAFSINPSHNIMVGTTGWLTASYDFIERVLRQCNDLIKKLIGLCTTQKEQNTLLQAQNTMLNAERECNAQERESGA